jgi:tyrosine-protein phosphatase non-receptor type 12/18/22
MPENAYIINKEKNIDHYQFSITYTKTKFNISDDKPTIFIRSDILITLINRLRKEFNRENLSIYEIGLKQIIVNDLINLIDNIDDKVKFIDSRFVRLQIEYDRKRDRYSNIRPYTFNVLPNTNVSVIRCPNINDRTCDINKFLLNCSLDEIYCFAICAPMITYIEQTLQMYMDNNIEAIINLTDFEEYAEVKADRYIPDNKKSIRYGDKILSTESIELIRLDKYKIEIKKCLIKTLNSNVQHKFTSIHVQDWKDYTSPYYPDLFKILKLTNQFKKIVIHCSAGVGRTGLFIATRHLQKIHEIREVTEKDIEFIIQVLRCQRYKCCGSSEQYNSLKKIKFSKL